MEDIFEEDNVTVEEIISSIIELTQITNRDYYFKVDRKGNFSITGEV